MIKKTHISEDKVNNFDSKIKEKFKYSTKRPELSNDVENKVNFVDGDGKKRDFVAPKIDIRFDD